MKLLFAKTIITVPVGVSGTPNPYYKIAYKSDLLYVITNLSQYYTVIVFDGAEIHPQAFMTVSPYPDRAKDASWLQFHVELAKFPIPQCPPRPDTANVLVEVYYDDCKCDETK